MKRKITAELIIFSLFNFMRIILLISVIVFVVIKKPTIISENNNSNQYAIFLLTLSIFCIDYFIGTVYAIKQFFSNRKPDQFWSVNSVIILMTVLVLSLTNNEPGDMLKSSAILLLFLMLKYISSLTPNTIDRK